MKRPVDTVNLSLYRWSTFRQRINVVDENGSPVNLTGHGAKLQVRASHAATAVLFEALDSDYLTPGNGFVDIEVPGGVSGPLTFASGVYDLFVTEPGTDYPVAVCAGVMSISPSVTTFS